MRAMRRSRRSSRVSATSASRRGLASMHFINRTVNTVFDAWLWPFQGSRCLRCWCFASHRTRTASTP
jgi:hypothetical protein